MYCLNDREMPYPRFCAHRGFNTIAPEGSLPAYGAAVALGAEEIELDVRPTRDGLPVVLHDKIIDRVSNGTGNVADYTLEELRKFDFGGHFKPEYAGLKIPTFEDVLAQFARRTIFNLHVKIANPDFIKRLAELIYAFHAEEHLYIMGSIAVHTVAKEIMPDVTRCMGAGDNRDGIVENAIAHGTQKLQFFEEHINQQMIDKAKKHGIICNYFYCDDPATARKWIDCGVDTILTNDYWRVSRG